MTNPPTTHQQARNAAVVARIIHRELASMDAAFARKDLKGGYLYFAPDYARYDVDGKRYTIADDLPGAQELMPRLQSVRALEDVRVVRSSGRGVDVDVQVRAVMNLLPRAQAATFVITHLEDTESRRQHWVPSPQSRAWLLESSRTTASRVEVYRAGKLVAKMINGKEMQ